MLHAPSLPRFAFLSPPISLFLLLTLRSCLPLTLTSASCHTTVNFSANSSAFTRPAPDAADILLPGTHLAAGNQSLPNCEPLCPSSPPPSPSASVVVPPSDSSRGLAADKEPSSPELYEPSKRRSLEYAGRLRGALNLQRRDDCLGQVVPSRREQGHEQQEGQGQRQGQEEEETGRGKGAAAGLWHRRVLEEVQLQRLEQPRQRGWQLQEDHSCEQSQPGSVAQQWEDAEEAEGSEVSPSVWSPGMRMRPRSHTFHLSSLVTESLARPRSTASSALGQNASSRHQSKDLGHSQVGEQQRALGREQLAGPQASQARRVNRERVLKGRGLLELPVRNLSCSAPDRNSRGVLAERSVKQRAALVATSRGSSLSALPGVGAHSSLEGREDGDLSPASPNPRQTAATVEGTAAVAGAAAAGLATVLPSGRIESGFEEVSSTEVGSQQAQAWASRTQDPPPKTQQPQHSTSQEHQHQPGQQTRQGMEQQGQGQGLVEGPGLAEAIPGADRSSGSAPEWLTRGVAARVIVRDSQLLASKVEAIRRAGTEKLQVIADFDRTLTTYRVNGVRGMSSHALVEQDDPVFNAKREALFNHYFPLETDPTIPLEEKAKLMVEWWTQSHKLLLEGGLSLAAISRSVSKANTQLRQGALPLFELLEEQGIPLLIFSAGLGDVIDEILRQRLQRSFRNVRIVSNRMEFDSKGNLVSFPGRIIHVLNKNEHALEMAAPLHERPGRSAVVSEPVGGCEVDIRRHTTAVLLGDHMGDLGMSQGARLDMQISVGFLNDDVERQLEAYTKAWDIVILDDGSLNVALNLIKRIVEQE